jgi:molecular chaperone HscB
MRSPSPPPPTAHRSSADPFTVLGVAPRFSVDLATAERNHRELSRALHPDRFTNASPAERRASLERATEVNEAWRTLRNPVTRAEALFRARGCEVGEAHEPKASSAFLMEVMEDQEGLADAREARNGAALLALAEKARTRIAEIGAELDALFGAPGTPSTDAMQRALPRLGELRFWCRLIDQARDADDD